MQARRRRGGAAQLAGVHGLVALPVLQLRLDIRRQRHTSQALQHFEEYAVVLELDNAVSTLRDLKDLGFELAAAPTAGLHFTKELLAKIAEKGVRECFVTLHVGLGTFRPVKAEDIEEHEMHSEFCIIPEETARIITETKRAGGRIVCVGTTSCRTVESFANEDGTMDAQSGWTNIFIYPGYKFKCLDALITNFHLPESTLIMLVSALAGREHVLAAYKEAVEKRYRFFSFGDAMFIS